MSHKEYLFYWKGVNRFGEFSKGHILARNITIAQDKLRQQDVIVRNISKKPNFVFWFYSRTVRSKEIAMLSRQMATTIATGIPFMQALQLISYNQSNYFLTEVLLYIQQDMQSGLSFSDALQKYPKIFNSLFINLVKIGEDSGTLNIILDKIATYLENKEKTKQKLKKSLTYPVILICMAIVLMVCLLIFLIPQFELLYKNFGATLPKFTLFVISISKYVQIYWGYVFVSLLLTFAICYYFYKYNRGFILLIDKLLLVIPIYGAILQKIILSRFMGVLAVTYTAGLSLIDALRLVINIVDNATYIKATNLIITKISEGERLQEAMRDSYMFPDFIINMISIGEESGSLAEMLIYVANYYEKTVEQEITAFSNLLEPFIMTMIGILIGVVVIAMYFPILKLGTVI